MMRHPTFLMACLTYHGTTKQSAYASTVQIGKIIYENVMPEQAKISNRGLADDPDSVYYNFMRHFFDRSCWCNLENSTSILTGRGVPLDTLDYSCKKLVDGYKCIQHDLLAEDPY